MPQNEIQQLLYEFAKQGKKPTLAQLKAKLSQSYPLPVLINALKQAPSKPLDPKDPAISVPTLDSLSKRIEQLEKTQIELIERIHTLEKANH
ncbi:hypothetical protein [Celerinatantimonas diazotrophica]|uniref:Uncharacterized protein n=1 Tax=Celerinatantimonas diazotrophica TaxID=412034 RepID=A0A4R1JA02_9GAMM|nr:hypothetical protein [Celerinatantimonas diazotrophica]TCK47274.1 hypothetical protein EV690_2983 [Celerinatantimonas diazotrophica]CAG9296046.1 hypothetical protein CEDIAZO_01185 [Celerinatantimonas diazotrophica]